MYLFISVGNWLGIPVASRDVSLIFDSIILSTLTPLESQRGFQRRIYDGNVGDQYLVVSQFVILSSLLYHFLINFVLIC